MGSADTVLVVEDDSPTREGLAVLLRLEGYHVLQAKNGGEALHLLRDGPRPDLILTREWAQANGCRGFLHKPVEAESLLAEVRRCLG